MPKKIGQLVGATKIHEIVFEGDKIKKKNMPNECSYQPVKIKVGRQIVRQRGSENPGGENLNDAFLERRRESIGSRRRRAAFKEVMDDLEDGLESDWEQE